MVASLVAGLALAFAVALGAEESRAAPGAYYLALGDSITYGYQPTKDGKPPSAFDTGYVDVFAGRLRAIAPGIRVVNYGCPGESTVTFVKGHCPWLAGGGRLHDAFKGPQLDAALAFLKAHPGQVSPITVTLWGNDLLAFEERRCHGAVRCLKRRGPGAVATIGARLRSILTRLRAAAPDAELIATGAWNLEVDRLRDVAFLFHAMDARIAAAAKRAGATVANMRAVFNPPTSFKAQRERLCSLTFLCSAHDPHPKNAGYQLMADAFLAASGYTGTS